MSPCREGMGKKQKKPGKGKEKTERKTAKGEEKRARRDSRKLTVNPVKETELILYGGEFYNGSKTFVYGDLYRYDVEKNEWKLVSSPNSPPPRSAHQTVAWKNNIYMFGGEFTSPNQERFHHYKDFWTLDLKTNQWEQILAKGCPSARSGHRMVLYKHKIVLFGGFYDTLREVRYYNDLHVFDLDHFKVKKAGMPPGPRAGFSMCVHKKRAVLFGGVVDMEVEGDVIMSMFMNELYGFQLDNHRWYPLELRKDKPAKIKARNIKRKESTNDVEANIIDDEGDEVMVDVEEAIEGQPEVNGVSNQLIKTLNITKDGSSRSIDVLSDSTAQESFLEAVKPSGRINACLAVGKDMLYLYGGMMEVKDREITLDDLYSLNLSKLDEWKCIISASESEWLEISEEEEDDDDETDDDENEEGDASQTDEDEEESDEDAAKNVSSAVSLLKGESKTMRRKEKRARIEQIRVILGLSDSQRTPVPGESLRDFYKRTNMYWQMAAYEHTQHTGKELRKDGFDLAETRFKELKPILDELAVLEAEQKAEEEASASTSSKRDTKKPKQKSARR
ncbi:Kelch domain-containing protein 4 [Zea mays]|uniref:Kelch domain-containing protein 4 n=1 Tax=Zea mays TaxID=4577 RepID=A0A3L6G3U4_MAIZE|nr:Kelch domain-containing protein 4 [Zea mays]